MYRSKILLVANLSVRHKEMENNIVYIIVSIIVGIFALKKLFGVKKRRSKVFTCARCKKVKLYTPRTIEEWERGIEKLYCQKCYKEIG